MHQVPGVVRELSGSAAGARYREELQLVAGKTAIDDRFSVGRPVEAVVGGAFIIEELFAMRAISTDDPQGSIAAFALVFERDFLAVRRPGRPRGAMNFCRQRKLSGIEHLPGHRLNAQHPELVDSGGATSYPGAEKKFTAVGRPKGWPGFPSEIGETYFRGLRIIGEAQINIVGALGTLVIGHRNFRTMRVECDPLPVRRPGRGKILVITSDNRKASGGSVRVSIHKNVSRIEIKSPIGEAPAAVRE